MMKDGERERSSERERERLCIKACKEERSCETEGSAKGQEKHVRTACKKLVQHSNRIERDVDDNRGRNAENNYSEAQIMSKGKDTGWEIANTESSPRLFSRSTNHLRYFETNIISRVIFLISFLARTFKISSRWRENSPDTWEKKHDAKRDTRIAPYHRDPSSPRRGPEGVRYTPSGPRRVGFRHGYHRPLALFRSISF